MVLSGSSKIRASRPQLPNSMAAPHIVLSSAPVSLADVQLVSSRYSQHVGNSNSCVENPLNKNEISTRY